VVVVVASVLFIADVFSEARPVVFSCPWVSSVTGSVVRPEF